MILIVGEADTLTAPQAQLHFAAQNFTSIYRSASIAGVGAIRLRCPVNVLGGGTPSSLTDRCTRYAFAFSATGSAKARGHWPSAQHNVTNSPQANANTKHFYAGRAILAPSQPGTKFNANSDLANTLR